MYFDTLTFETEDGRAIEPEIWYMYIEKLWQGSLNHQSGCLLIYLCLTIPLCS